MKELSHEEKLVMQSAVLQAETSVDKLAKHAGMHSSKFRRILERLHANKIFIGKRAFVNTFALGLQQYQIFLSLGSGSQKDLLEFPRFLCSFDGVMLVAELGGAFQYEFRICLPSSRAVTSLIDKIVGTYRTARIQGIAILCEYEYSTARYIPERPTYVPALCSAPLERPVSIDKTDHQILSRIANTDYGSFHAVARAMGIPSATLTYRIRQLEEKGVIIGYCHICDVKPAGQLPVLVLVEACCFDDAASNKFFRFCREHPSIAYAYRAIGVWPASFLACAQSHEHVLTVIHDLRSFLAGSILSTHMLDQLKFHKYSAYPFKEYSSLGW